MRKGPSVEHLSRAGPTSLDQALLPCRHDGREPLAPEQGPGLLSRSRAQLSRPHPPSSPEHGGPRRAFCWGGVGKGSLLHRPAPSGKGVATLLAKTPLGGREEAQLVPYSRASKREPHALGAGCTRSETWPPSQFLHMF